MRSMTAIAQGRGSYQQPDGDLEIDWEWEVRSVNSRGLDVRLRLPDGLAALEKLLRDRLSATLSRGAVTVSLRLSVASRMTAASVDKAALSDTLDALAQIAEIASQRGVALRKFSAVELMSQRGILASGHDRATFAPETLVPVLAQDFDRMAVDLDAMRAAEGAELHRILAAQVTRIADLTAQARACLPERTDMMAANLARALDRLRGSDMVDESRIAQELALIAVKSDVSEELDRLEAHCVAARALLGADGPVGRKLDFLTQEFNREANTLCSKAQHDALTRIGLDLKSVIDQMREQVQNVE